MVANLNNKLDLRVSKVLNLAILNQTNNQQLPTLASTHMVIPNHYSLKYLIPLMPQLLFDG